MAATRYKLIFFVPPASLAPIKTALFAAGAGRFPGRGSYTEVCWTSAPGTGQFRPGSDAKPAIGEAGGEVEEVQEVRCEVLCVGTEVVGRAVGELRRTHTYETPAYEVYRMEDF